MEGCQLQELHQTNNFCCRFDQSNPTGLGFSSCICAKGGGDATGSFLASDQLIYLDYYYPSANYQTSSSSSHSSQVSMDGEWSPNNFLNSNNMQANSIRKFSDEHQQEQPWYGTNVQATTTDDFNPYTYGQFEAAELTTSILARSDEQYSMPQFDHHHHQLGNPNDHDQSFFPTSTKQQTILKSSKTSGVKRKNQAKKKSEHNIEKRARTATNSSPAGNISYNNNKIGKEKMGDRISTLQRLVSPFGKGDTASVLSECIEYIRFLHEQVSALSSTSYVTKNGAQMQHFQDLDECFYDDCVSRSGSETGLRGRGLCIVPISSTFSLNHETPTDFGTPRRSDHNLQS